MRGRAISSYASSYCDRAVLIPLGRRGRGKKLSAAEIKGRQPGVLAGSIGEAAAAGCYSVPWVNGAPRPMKMCTIASPWHYDAVREFTLSYPTSCSSLRAHSDRNVHVPLFAFDVFEPGPASRA